MSSVHDSNPERLVSGVRRAPGTVAVRPEIVVGAAVLVFILLGIMLWLIYGKAMSLLPNSTAAAAVSGGVVASAAPANPADLGYTARPEAIDSSGPAVVAQPVSAATIDPTLLAGAPVGAAPAPPQEPAAVTAAAPPPAAVADAPRAGAPAVQAARDRASRAEDEQRAAAAADLQVQLSTSRRNLERDAAATTSGSAAAADAPPAARAANRFSDPDDYDIAPGSEFVLQRGELIPVSLYTSVDSTIAGLVTGYVNADVWDGQHAAVVIPRGAKLIGTFGSGASQGQKRIGVAWDSIKLPNGHTIVLEDFPGVDLTGTSGFGAAVDNHTRKLFGNVILLSILAAGAQLAQPQTSACGSYGGGCAPSLGQSVAQSVGTNIANAATQIFQRDANITPTLHVVEGAQVGVMVLRDLPMRAWRQP